MKFGHFDDIRREYVIEHPDTPLPWINYLGCEDFFGLISNTGGGYCFYRDARLRRLTRYRYNNVPGDCGGRYLYLRDDDTGAFWSPTWQPTRTELEAYSCRHGMGYSIIASQYSAIEASVRYFVPLGQTLEVWQAVITNRRSSPAQLSLFSAIEFCLWDALDDASNFQRNFNTGEVEVEGSVIYHKTEYRERRDHFAYFACSEALTGFDTQREAFLGAYRGWDRPRAVEEGKSGESIAHGWAPIGSHQVNLRLQPGESRTVTFLLGYQENPPEQKFDPVGSQTLNKQSVHPIIARYLQPDEVEKAFDGLQHYWNQLLDAFQVNTPDEHTNRMVNIWNAYQCMVTFNLSRSASYFESGIGRGMGFRDSNQDLLGFVHMIPAKARQRILDLAATQLPTGGAYHQYQPLTKRGNNDVGGDFNDDPLWLVLAVSAYLKETGEWGVLDERVPYDNQPGSEQPLYEHLQRSLRYTIDRLGPHGLPLIGRADWNDCLNLNCFSDTPGQSFQTTTNREGKVAESVFIGGLFALAANEMAALSSRYGRRADADFYRLSAQKMSATVMEHGWDGEWFLRAYDALGERVGSKDCPEGQIFIEPQGICVLAGLGATDGRAEKALASVRERLATQHGIVLLQPAFTRYYLNLGEISSYPPGTKENASVFCHTNPWIMAAEASLGHGDQAYDYYMRINPSAREAISAVHRSEPYVYAQTIAGKDAPSFGEAKNSWLTGTAAWNFVAITQWILGIRPTLDGLQIAPAIPAAWQGFEARRLYRGVSYVIRIERRGRGNRVRLEVNGAGVEGNVIPIPAVGVREVKVTAFLL
ncbi:cellobiose phosphorylase [Longilinea arvoryzae]|uniref:Cellobiose phosphorylase n=1 Tax=Longilinea arvoryzae TaxID=360412 RepID=A0A0S7BIL0_9CHLR|nr:glycosyl transferase [Longilinea arvoryzae]GAP15597.1 cellobiose phosphorylase [Longilinea arvoryzae]